MPTGRYLRTTEYRSIMRLAQLGKKHSKDTLLKMGSSQKGHKVSEETRQKISLARKGLPGKKGYRHTDHAKIKIREARIKYMMSNSGPYTNTKPEKIVEAELRSRGIDYVHPYHVSGMKCVADFFVKPNIIIECDGDYWHNLPGRKEYDIIRTNTLVECGFKVYRFWEYEIYENVKMCIDKVFPKN